MIRVGAILGATAALVLPGAVSAQSQSRFSADVSGTAGYSSNPVTVQDTNRDGSTGAAVVTLDIAPRYQLVTPRSTFTVSADANLQRYLRRYGSTNGYSGALDYQGQPSERVTTHARLEASSVVLGASNSYLPFTTGIGAAGGGIVVPGTGVGTDAATAVPIIPVTTVATPISYTDVGLYGLRNRRDLGRASGDLGLTLSAQDSLSFSAFGEASRYHDSNASNVAGVGLNDYDAYGGSANYWRRLSDRISVGVRGSASSYNYHDSDADNRVYSISATASGQINERWTADGAIGVSFVNGGGLRSTRSTSLSGNINLCRRGPLTSMCVQAARQVSPTGFAGSQYATTLGASWARRLDERQNVSLSANYSHVGGSDTRLVDSGWTLQNDYAQVQANYSRRVAPRLRFVALANYRQLFGGSYGNVKDIGGQIGLSYRIGDRR